MRYKKRIGTSTWVAAGVLALVAVGLAVFMWLRAGKPAQNKSVEVIGSETGVLLQEEKLTKECTYGCITFKVGDDWAEVEDEDATFIYSDGVTRYALLAVWDPTMGDDLDGYFTDLIASLMDQGYKIDPKGLKPLKPYTTADGREAYVGRILMSMDDMAYAESDILIFPDIKYVVTITGVQKTGSKLPLDVRKITDTVRIIY